MEFALVGAAGYIAGLVTAIVIIGIVKSLDRMPGASDETDEDWSRN